LEALGIAAVTNVEYNEDTSILLLEIEGTTTLAKLEPDFAALYRSHDSINGVVVTARSDSDDYDFHSRYFWPWSGGDEDPVTGGTHTFLAKYWGDRLRKTKMRSFQSSKRSGILNLELMDDFVLIGGQAQIVLKGSLLKPSVSQADRRAASLRLPELSGESRQSAAVIDGWGGARRPIRPPNLRFAPRNAARRWIQGRSSNPPAEAEASRADHSTQIGSSPCGGPRLECAGSSDARSSPPPR
jgi:hypothetical protein